MFESSEEICEALVRHVELTGSELFEKNFVKNGRVVCSVWCIVGDNASAFRDMVHAWLEQEGFKDDSAPPQNTQGESWAS